MKPTPLALLLFLILPCLVSPAAEPPQPVAKVVRIIDGDTVVVLLDNEKVTVRLIGVDAPESVDPRKTVERFAREASEFLQGLIKGKVVRLAHEPAGAEEF